MSDGVIHTAFIHDFLNYAPAAETDRRAIETLGTALAGTNRPLAVTSGTLLLQRQGPIATEGDAPNRSFPGKSEEAALSAASQGVRASVLRLPPSVYGIGSTNSATLGVAIQAAGADCRSQGWALFRNVNRSHTAARLRSGMLTMLSCWMTEQLGCFPPGRATRRYARQELERRQVPLGPLGVITVSCKLR
jgi:hypothetical protein